MKKEFTDDQIYILKMYLEEYTAITYPIRLFKVRNGLLNKTETKKVKILYNKVTKLEKELQHTLEEELDKIIYERAVKENDSWE